MRQTIWFLVLVAGAAATTWGQGVKKDDFVRDDAGNASAGAEVRVCRSGTLCDQAAHQVIIYSDRALTTEKNNPTVTAGNGYYFFYAPPGRYNIRITVGAVSTLFPDVVLGPDVSQFVRSKEIGKILYAEEHCATPGTLNETCLNNAITACGADCTIVLPLGTTATGTNSITIEPLAGATSGLVARKVNFVGHSVGGSRVTHNFGGANPDLFVVKGKFETGPANEAMLAGVNPQPGDRHIRVDTIPTNFLVGAGAPAGKWIEIATNKELGFPAVKITKAQRVNSTSTVTITTQYPHRFDAGLSEVVIAGAGSFDGTFTVATVPGSPTCGIDVFPCTFTYTQAGADETLDPTNGTALWEGNDNQCNQDPPKAGPVDAMKGCNREFHQVHSVLDTVTDPGFDTGCTGENTPPNCNPCGANNKCIRLQDSLTRPHRLASGTTVNVVRLITPVTVTFDNFAIEDTGTAPATDLSLVFHLCYAMGSKVGKVKVLPNTASGGVGIARSKHVDVDGLETGAFHNQVIKGEGAGVEIGAVAVQILGAASHVTVINTQCSGVGECVDVAEFAEDVTVSGNHAASHGNNAFAIHGNGTARVSFIGNTTSGCTAENATVSCGPYAAATVSPRRPDRDIKFIGNQSHGYRDYCLAVQGGSEAYMKDGVTVTGNTCRSALGTTASQAGMLVAEARNAGVNDNQVLGLRSNLFFQAFDLRAIDGGSISNNLARQNTAGETNAVCYYLWRLKDVTFNDNKAAGCFDNFHFDGTAPMGTSPFPFSNIIARGNLSIGKSTAGGSSDWKFTPNIDKFLWDATPLLEFTTGSIGGGPLAEGACATGTVTVPGAETDRVVEVVPSTATGPGTHFTWRGYVSAADTVTVEVCNRTTGSQTPAARTYVVKGVR